jgi:hypothetical protein
MMGEKTEYWCDKCLKKLENAEVFDVTVISTSRDTRIESRSVYQLCAEDAAIIKSESDKLGKKA